MANAAARLTAVVVLPTPPFWLATARTSGVVMVAPGGKTRLSLRYDQHDAMVIAPFAADRNGLTVRAIGRSIRRSHDRAAADKIFDFTGCVSCFGKHFSRVFSHARGLSPDARAVAVGPKFDRQGR
jgi:hypothetical protein